MGARRWTATGAGWGALAWIFLAWLSAVNRVPIGLPELLFLAAPLIVVPLGLRLNRTPSLAASLACFLQPLGALMVVASFCLHRGPVSAAWACPWLGVSALAGLSGLREIRAGRWGAMEDICTALGHLYLPVGAAWLVISRLGSAPFGFGEPIALLTAVHFHYAGFAASLIAGESARMARRSGTRPRVLETALLAGIAAGPALVAAGFMVSEAVRLAATIILGGCLIGLAIQLLARLPLVRPPLPRGLLMVSSACVAAGMLLALAYAFGEFSHRELVGIPQMVRLHGAVNGLGFAVGGLLAFNLMD